MNDRRIKGVAFIDQSLLSAFEKIKSGRFEDRQLAVEIDGAMDRLKEDPFAGVKVERRLWPKEYVRRYSMDNLRKYDMRDGWRLLYTISGDRVEIVSIVLEWLDHKGHERRFGYRSR